MSAHVTAASAAAATTTHQDDVGGHDIRRGALVAVDEGASLRISVRSEGDGFEHDLRADPGVFSDFLRESGRGVQIILHVVDEVSIEESGSIVTLRMGKDDSQRRNSSIPS